MNIIINVTVIAWLIFDGGTALVIKDLLSDSTSSQGLRLDVNASMPKFATAFKRSDTLSKSRQVITLIMSTSYSGEMPVGAISTKAMELALDRLRQLPNWLPQYDLALELVDDECIDSTTTNRVIPKLLRSNDEQEAFNRFPLLLSPGCEAFGLRTVAELVKYFNFVAVSGIQTSMEPFKNRRRFPSFFSLGEKSDLPHIALAQFISKMSWKRVAIISERFPYYDELEKTFLSELDKDNATLLWIGKVSHAGVFEDEMRTALDEMIIFDPRVIVVDADRGAGKACWLYRYGLYGPNYVTFFFYWSDVYPISAVPDNIDWCTLAMIDEVLASSFILGDALQADTTDSRQFSDSTGITGPQWEAEMENKLWHPTQSPFWNYWRMLSYDLTLFAGFVINETEEILNSRNETLLDWVTSSTKFQNNGSAVVDVLKEALYSVGVKGLKGEYRFKQATAVNSGGFTPISFTQRQRNRDGSAKDVLVAIYQSNKAQKFEIFVDKIVWQTEDRLPPKDAITIIPVEVPIVSLSAFSFLIAVATTECVSCLGVIVAMVFQRRLARFLERKYQRPIGKFHFADFLIVIGDLIMLGQVFALPPKASSEIPIRCVAMAIFLLYGFTLSIFGKLAKLENARLYVLVRSINNDQVIKVCWLATSATLLIIFNTSLFVPFLVISPLQLKLVNLTSMNSSGSYLGKRAFYQLYRFQCAFANDITRDSRAMVLLALIAVAIGLALLRLMYVAYKLRSVLGQMLSAEVRCTCVCIYCTVSLIAAGGLLCTLLSDSVYIVISCMTLAYVPLSAVLSIPTKLSKCNTVQWRDTHLNHNMAVYVTQTLRGNQEFRVLNHHTRRRSPMVSPRIAPKDTTLSDISSISK